MIYGEVYENLKEDADYLADINEDTVEESEYEVGLEGAMMHILEAEENWNAIHRAIAITEYSMFQTTGEEVVFEEEQSKSMFDTVIAWFKNVWEKIVKSYKKFVNYMAAKVKNDKGFVKKFKDTKITVPANFQRKGYVFNTTAFSLLGSDAKVNKIIAKALPASPTSIATGAVSVEVAKQQLTALKADQAAILSQMRGAALDKSEGVDAKEFKTELFKLFRSQKVKPEMITITQSDLAKYVNVVENHKSAVDGAKKAMDEMKKVINTAIDGVKTLKNKLKADKGDKTKLSVAMSHANAWIKLKKDEIAILSAINGAKVSALDAENRQAKAFMYAVQAAQTKATNEAAGLDTDNLFAAISFQ